MIMEKKNPMQVAVWQTFSIFINSTFADMQAEKSHLLLLLASHSGRRTQQR
jgi:hypothetical protein